MKDTITSQTGLQNTLRFWENGITFQDLAPDMFLPSQAQFRTHHSVFLICFGRRHSLPKFVSRQTDMLSNDVLDELEG